MKVIQEINIIENKPHLLLNQIILFKTKLDAQQKNF